MKKNKIKEIASLGQEASDKAKDAAKEILDIFRPQGLEMNGPVFGMSIRLPIFGYWMVKYNHNKPWARKLARIFGVDTTKLNEQKILDKLKDDPIFFEKLRGGFFVMLNGGDPNPLKNLLGLEENAVREIFDLLVNIVYRAEVLSNVNAIIQDIKNMKSDVKDINTKMDKMLDISKIDDQIKGYDFAISK